MPLHRAISSPGVARQLSIHAVTDPFLSSTAVSPASRRHDKVSPAVSQPEFIDTDFSSPLFSDDDDSLGLNLTTVPRKTTSMMNRVVSSAAPYQQPPVVRGSLARPPMMRGVQFAGRTPTANAMPMLVPQQQVNYGKTLTHTVLPSGAVIQQQPQQGTMFICMPVQQQQQLLQQQQQQLRLPQQQQQVRLPQQRKAQAVSRSQQLAFPASAAPHMIGQPGVSYQPVQPLILDGQFTGQQFVANAGNTVFMPVQRMPAASMQRPQQQPLQQQPLQQQPLQQQQQQQRVTMAAVRSASVPVVSYVRNIQPKSVMPATATTTTIAEPQPPVRRRRRRQWHQMFINNRMPVRFTPSPALPVTSTSILSIPKVPLQPYLARPGDPRAVSAQQIMSPISSHPVLHPRFPMQPPPARLLLQPQLQPLNMVVRPPVAIAPRHGGTINGAVNRTQSSPAGGYRLVDMSMQPTDLSVKSTARSTVAQSVACQPTATDAKKMKQDTAMPSSGQVNGGKTTDVKEEKSVCVIDSTTQGEGKWC